ncbi:hypothetical protein NX059_003270 [Plenodomus lindquistii]|nr:hypothetical protein NX059_003270 [Plenodomus lindquistii]
MRSVKSIIKGGSWRSRKSEASSDNTVAGAEQSQTEPISSPSPSPASVGSALRPRSVGDARRASEPNESISPTQSPHRTISKSHSTFDVDNRSRSRSSNRSNDPLGLTVIYQPETHPPLDIIFVHGLGGTSRATWSKGRDLNYFWPERWLPSEPAISSARILSFGYNANFAAVGPAPITGIADFAKDLLYSMKFAKDGDLNELDLGKRPIIFIVHSMGGLVVKQAYILGQNDENYSDIVSSISAILFLATPHRGSDLAEILNRILTVSIFNHSPKMYVGELKHGSPTIQALNEQFRHIAPKLDILSFYETLPTAVGPKKMMVVEKASATLGYSAEISKSLSADHHSVCKYDSVHDTNYVSIRNALKTLVTTIRSKGTNLTVRHSRILSHLGQHLLAAHSKSEIEQLETLLAVSENYHGDLDFFRKRWTTGTCEWILGNPSFKEWLNESDKSKMLWLNALPASGKSVLSAFVVNHLLQESFCAFYFFRFGDQVKRSASTCLRTIIFQLAEQLPRFRTELQEIRFSSKSVEKMDVKSLWEKVFVNVLFKMRLTTTMTWVIDALDESDSPQALLELMQDVSKSTSTIKVLLVSRRTPDLITTFDRLSMAVPVVHLPIEETKRDIRAYVDAEIQYMHAKEDFKSQIVSRLVAGAGSNFLWARLALVEVMKCNTEEDLDETLESIPIGMGNLYQRMERTIIASTKPRDQKLGQMILTWSVCSRRPLLLRELSQALQPEFSIMTDINIIINRVCGQFVAVDSTDKLVMIHQTARDHITSTSSVLGVKVPEGHGRLFTKCISVLEEKPSRRYGSSKALDYQDFLYYATTSWNYHLNLLSSESDAPLIQLAKFLRSNSVLNWIASLAKKNLLRVLVYSSKAMTYYVRRKRTRNLDINPLEHRIQELELIEAWAVDFLKIIGKFGSNLIEAPNSIYQQIPPFCPRNSAIFRHFEHSARRPHSLAVTGVARADWDDNSARLSLGSNARALIVVASGNNIAVATGSGRVVLYHTTTFEVKRHLNHNQRISAMSFSDNAKLIATYGYSTTKVWSVDTGLAVNEIPNPRLSTAFTIVFAKGDTELMIGSNDRLLRIVNLTVACPSWVILHPTILKDDTVLDRPVQKVPWRIAFSPDRNYIAVAYRNFPLSVWSLDDEGPELIGRLMRDRNYAGNAWTVVDQVTWHSNSQEVVGLFMGGQAFRWNPFQNTQQELQAEASILTISPDGNFFAIGESNGNIMLYDFHHFSMVYQLSCDNMINDICFSPDGKRLYDVRGQYCNVWEPNVLIRSEENEVQNNEEGSEVASIPTLAVSEAFADARDQITAIAVQIQGRYQAVGNEAGMISIVDTAASDSRAIMIWQAPLHMAIVHLAWSDDGSYLTCSELTGRVVVKRVQMTGEDTWKATAVFNVMVMANGDGIQHVYLNHDGSLLMVKSGPKVTVRTVAAADGVNERENSIESLDTRWIKHPQDKNLLLAFDCTRIFVHRWRDLENVATFDLDNPVLAPGLHIENEELRINGIYPCPSGSQYIIDILRITSSGETRHTTTFLLPPLDSANSGGAITLTLLSVDLQNHVEVLLGFIPKDRMVFLDKNYWMCSIPLNAFASADNIQRHYYLPKDWLNAKYLAYCAVLQNGKFLIPNNGDLAVVTCTGMNLF